MGKETKKIFAIGDIHGCLGNLTQLLERLPYDPESDTLVFLGDYINRGKNAYEVLELVADLKQRGDVITLVGNHEQLLLDYDATQDSRLIPFLREMGIEATMTSYRQQDLHLLQNLEFMPERHRRIMKSLLPFWETESYLFVHAGFLPEIPLQDHSVGQLTEMRDFCQTDDARLNKTVVFGHTPFLTPFVKERKIGIDTGAYAGNLLTAVELPARIFYHA